MAKPRDLLHMIEDTNALNSKIGKMIFFVSNVVFKMHAFCTLVGDALFFPPTLGRVGIYK